LYLTINHLWRLRPGGSVPTASRTADIVCRAATFVAVLVAWVPFRAADLPTTLRMWKAMFPVWRLPAEAMRAGPISGWTIAAFMAAGAVVLLSPKIIFPSAGDGLRPVQAAAGALVWRPSVGWAFATGAALMLGILTFSRAASFLYFQF
jgi:hypothetical protein